MYPQFCFPRFRFHSNRIKHALRVWLVCNKKVSLKNWILVGMEWQHEWNEIGSHFLCLIISIMEWNLKHIILLLLGCWNYMFILFAKLEGQAWKQCIESICVWNEIVIPRRIERHFRSHGYGEHILQVSNSWLISTNRGI